MSVFVNTDIYIPKKYQNYFHKYSRTHDDGSGSDPERSPFPRVVDVWFLALCIAIREGITPAQRDPKEKTYKGVLGQVFSSDDWRSNILMLLAIAETGSIDILSDPTQMMRIANGYAFAGLPRLIEILESRGGVSALDHLSDEIRKIIEDR